LRSRVKLAFHLGFSHHGILKDCYSPKWELSSEVLPWDAHRSPGPPAWAYADSSPTTKPSWDAPVPGGLFPVLQFAPSQPYQDSSFGEEHGGCVVPWLAEFLRRCSWGWAAGGGERGGRESQLPCFIAILYFYRLRKTLISFHPLSLPHRRWSA